MKVVIPSAGFGTRNLPVTKVVPKELFPIYDKPAIHYVVEECVKSGIKEIIFVLSEDKLRILDYFGKNDKLENFLRQKGKIDLLKPLQIFDDIKIDYVIQKEQLGLGDAVLQSKEKIEDENFCVALPDDIIVSDKPALYELIETYKKLERKSEITGVVGLFKIPKKELFKYGVVSGKMERKDTILIEKIVEKPAPENAPSNLAIVGRYVFSRKVFTLLEKEPFDESGEIQLAGAIGKAPKIFGKVMSGKWFDVGSKDGFSKAVNFFAKGLDDS